MRMPDILIILGCLAAGYWIVSSIMGSGSAKGPAGRDEQPERRPEQARNALPGTDPEAVHDWHIVLDIPRDASLSEIEAARKRRLAAAANADDRATAVRIQKAADWALRQKR